MSSMPKQLIEISNHPKNPTFISLFVDTLKVSIIDFCVLTFIYCSTICYRATTYIKSNSCDGKVLGACTSEHGIPITQEFHKCLVGAGPTSGILTYLQNRNLTTPFANSLPLSFPYRFSILWELQKADTLLAVRNN